MTRNKLQEDMDGLRRSDPDDMWHALTRLHASHPEPVDRFESFERPGVLLSLANPDDVLFRARVELSGGETTSSVRTAPGYAVQGEMLEILVGKRHDLALHPAHVYGLTQLLRDATAAIGARSTSEGGRCFHCDGTGRARPLWDPAAGQA
ncbi:hypothetical protein ACFWCB_05395 [Streptomyces sp. NPDC060048]|uniref:hypothetical protein n=1 Tax=unclassified Streptomyces TaxID=2593676 RepID=UPI00368C31AE